VVIEATDGGGAVGGGTGISRIVAAMSVGGGCFGPSIPSGVGAHAGTGGWDEEFGDWGESGILWRA
jgi:hypothetical protein